MKQAVILRGLAMGLLALGTLHGAAPRRFTQNTFIRIKPRTS